jgi:Tol biopolymer transport system component
MRQELHAQVSTKRVLCGAIPLFFVGMLLAGCQGADRALAPSLGAPQFSRSSDGQDPKGKIAFHSNRDGDFEIFVMNADGTQQTQLTHNDSQEFDPMWSPDGKQIGFSSIPAFTRENDFEIFVMKADGTGITQLTDNEAQDFGPIWSPDGKRIVFYSNRDGPDDIYAMNPDGTHVTRLTTDAFVWTVTAWSPNGKQIAFTSWRDYDRFGLDGDLEILVMNADGTGITQLTDNTVDDEGDHAGWSPDGKLFSFSSRRDGGDLDIFVMKPNGTGVRQLTGIGGDSGVDDDDSFWSPDGKQIAFHSTRDGDEEVYFMKANGSGVTQLTFNAGISDAVPAWISGKLGSGKNEGNRDQ